MRRLLPFLLMMIAAPALAATPEERLATAGHSLPPAPKPAATYVTSVETGNLLFLSGHIDCIGGGKRGKVGADVTLDEGKAEAQRVGLCMLATVKDALGGDLSRVKRFVRILGMVNSAPDFTAQPQVINGFSELMKTAFGDAGLAARSAVGVASLPAGYAVEIEATIEIAR